MSLTPPLRILILLLLSGAAGIDSSHNYPAPKAGSKPVSTLIQIGTTEETAPSVSVTNATDFHRDILPIMKQCTPCHFPGGSMYARLPFDQPQTIHTLGEKLFSRIKKENDQRVIRQFLAQGKAGMGTDSKQESSSTRDRD